MRILHINAKCSDLFNSNLYEDRTPVGKEHCGYVPDFMRGENWGFYVVF
jgi:hypothetical protein